MILINHISDQADVTLINSLLLQTPFSLGGGVI